jgi:nucleotide-binding universal stress UspA family protein
MVVSELLGKRVLLAIDGSEGTEVAARAAAEVAEGTVSALHLVYVEPLPDFVKNGDGAPGYDRELYEKEDRGRGAREAPEAGLAGQGGRRDRGRGPPQDGSGGRGDRGSGRRIGGGPNRSGKPGLG